MIKIEEYKNTQTGGRNSPMNNGIKLKKVIFASPTANMDNGAELCLIDLLKGLPREQIDPVVLVPELGRLTMELDAIGIRWIAVDLRWFGGNNQELYWFAGSFNRIMKLQKIIRQENASLVYTNTIMIVEAAIVARMIGVKHIWHIHEGPIDGQIGKIKGIIRSAIIAITTYRAVVLTSRALEYFSVFRPQIFSIIPNGTDLIKFNPNRSNKKLETTDSIFVIGIFGSILENKGQTDLIDAIYLLMERIPTVRCLIVGGGNESSVNALRLKIEGLGLSDQIRLVGHSHDIANEFKLVNLVVSASRRETFPRVILEAMASGLPVVATRSGGPEDMILDGITGLLVPPRDPVALANAIHRVHSLEDKGSSMGDAGRKLVSDRFSIEKYRLNLNELIINSIT